MTEHEMIRLMTGKFPRSPAQGNRLFECDAELIEIGGQTWGMSMDSFSPEEDLFTSENPARLGANLAIATLSDLLAAAIEPRLYMHAISLPRDAPPGFAGELTDGIRAILEQAGCFLIGGDTGTARTWQYCGFAAGPAARTPLTRIFRADSSALWTTGKLGDANLAAFSNAPTPPFELRIEEARHIQPHATACMDTSGGLMDALWTLHALNPDWRMDIELTRIPYAEGLRETARNAGLPPEAALIGGAGEYELIFAAPATYVPPAALAQITRIGRLSPAHRSPGIFLENPPEPPVQIRQPPPCPRAAPSLSAYIADILDYTRHLYTP